MTALRSPFAPGFTPDAAADLAATLKVLADPTRLTILSVLAASGRMTGTEVEACVPLKQPTVSHHLRLLAEAGFITATREGSFNVRELNPARVAEVARLLIPGR